VSEDPASIPIRVPPSPAGSRRSSAPSFRKASRTPGWEIWKRDSDADSGRGIGERPVAGCDDSSWAPSFRPPGSAGGLGTTTHPHESLDGRG
jgi:hypothetical protein